MCMCKSMGAGKGENVRVCACVCARVHMCTYTDCREIRKGKGVPRQQKHKRCTCRCQRNSTRCTRASPDRMSQSKLDDGRLQSKRSG